MIDRRTALRGLAGAFFAGGLAAVGLGGAGADEKKTEKKGGTVTGEVKTKGPNFVEVLADGEDNPRKYVPHWRGGLPAQGGGPDKAMVAKIKEIKVGDRVRLEWEFEERARVVKIEVLKTSK
jgi:hypothetical protein